jgi:hypothetical protein
MNYPKYFYQQNGRFYFRRRIPGLSTVISPVIVSLGTKNLNIAYTWLVKLTVEFDEMLEDFALRHEELPEELVSQYMIVRLKEAMKKFDRTHRLQRFLGRGGSLSKENLVCLQVALETIRQDGLRKAFPTNRICPDWSPKTLRQVLHFYDDERRVMKSQKLQQELGEEFHRVTGMAPWTHEHHDQIMDVYLHARLAALDSLEEQTNLRSLAFKEMSNRVLEQTNLAPMFGPSGKPTATVTMSGNLAAAPATDKPDFVLTPGVSIVQNPLTLELLNQHFDAAETCDETLHRSPKTEPFGIDIAGACERSIKIAIAAGKIDQKTADSRRAKVKLFCLLANVQTVTEVEQYHLRVFDEQLDNLPNNFNRSPKDAKLTLKEISIKADAMADHKLGRAPM